MKKLSKESAERHYKKLTEIYYFEYLTLAQKVSVFQQDLEHDILKIVTGKKDYFDQLNFLKDNQKRMINGKEQGSIPPAYVSDIENLKKWRNRGVHEDEMPETKYRNHFHTMAQTICLFSDIPIPENINDILFNRTNNKRNISGTKRNKVKFGKRKSIETINKKLSLNINKNNTTYSSINENLPQWSFEINNSKFNNDINLILEDQDEKILYYFIIKGGIIREPENNFYQRNDDYVKNTSLIIIPTNDKNFADKAHNKNIQFIKYLKTEIEYGIKS